MGSTSSILVASQGRTATGQSSTPFASRSHLTLRQQRLHQQQWMQNLQRSISRTSPHRISDQEGSNRRELCKEDNEKRREGKREGCLNTSANYQQLVVGMSSLEIEEHETERKLSEDIRWTSIVALDQLRHVDEGRLQIAVDTVYNVSSCVDFRNERVSNSSPYRR